MIDANSPINPPSPKSMWQREDLLHLLTLAATLAGLCITGVALFHTLGRSAPQTIVDDALAISALLFLICTYTTFFALRVQRGTLAHTLEKVADTLFLVALTGMLASGFIMVYTLW